MYMPVFQTNLTCSCFFIRWWSFSYAGAPSQPACFPGGTVILNLLSASFSWNAAVLWSSLPRLGKQPCHQDQCEVSFKSISPANLLEGWLLGTGHCFTFPALLPSVPYMASLSFLIVFGQTTKQNRTRCNGWKCFVCLKKENKQMFL